MQHVAERVGQPVDVQQRFVVAFFTHQHRQRVQRVEQEVRADLVGQHVVARLQVFVFELLVFDRDVLFLVNQFEYQSVQHRNDQHERAFHDVQRIIQPAGHQRDVPIAAAAQRRDEQVEKHRDRNG